MSRDDLNYIDGVVSEAVGSNAFKILLDNGITLPAVLSGRLKRFRIRILVGDRVTVGLSPYDSKHGLITRRL